MTEYPSPFACFMEVALYGLAFTGAMWFIVQALNTNHYERWIFDESDRGE
ncbi:MAG: hypothetical protein JNL96_28830 [Planctomycetaceae bacterium]|nr:hypothetical protein [Planctomycetaceae bacterium]